MNIYESITAIMTEVSAVGKDKKNAQQGFNYRGIDDVMNAMQPLLARHKVFVVPEILEQSREERQTNKGGNLIYSICKIKFTFYAEDGTNISAVTIGEGMDSGDKATNKAMSIAFKYALFQVFCIPTEEMSDPDAEINDVKPKNGGKNGQNGNGKANGQGGQKPLSEAQMKRLYSIGGNAGYAPEQIHEYIAKKYKQPNPYQMNKAQYDELCNYLDGLAKNKGGK